VVNRAFRLSIGRGKCRDVPQGETLQSQVCHAVNTRIDAILLSGSSSHLSYSEGREEVLIQGKAVTITTSLVALEGAGNLVVVQAFYMTLFLPTFFAVGRIGKIFAEGVVIEPSGKRVLAPDDLLWAYR